MPVTESKIKLNINVQGNRDGQPTIFIHGMEQSLFV